MGTMPVYSGALDVWMWNPARAGWEILFYRVVLTVHFLFSFFHARWAFIESVAR